MSSKMMKTAEGLVLRVTFDDEQIEELKAYIDECFKQLKIEIGVNEYGEDY